MAEMKIQETGYYAYEDFCDELHQVLHTFIKDICTEINRKSILVNCLINDSNFFRPVCNNTYHFVKGGLVLSITFANGLYQSISSARPPQNSSGSSIDFLNTSLYSRNSR